MSIVNLGDMISEARNLLDDTIDGGDDSAALWKTAELTVYANEAVNEVVLRTNLLGSNVDVAGFNAFTIAPADDPWQTVDDRVMRLLRVTWDGKCLEPTSRNALDERSRDWEFDTGEPTHFILDQGSRQIRPYPRPNFEGSLRLEVRHLPLILMAVDADVPVIPAHMLQPAVFWMLHLAYLKNDADTKDDNLAAKHMSLFDQRFGPRPSYRMLEFNMRSLRAAPRARFEYR